MGINLLGFSGLGLVICYVALCGYTINASAAEVKTPERIDGVILIGAEGIIELLEKREDLILIDSRIEGDRHKGYLESSISLPDTETSCKTLSQVIPKSNTPSLFYCNGVKCGRSAVALKKAKACGYTELFWFRGGFEVWLEKGLPYIRD